MMTYPFVRFIEKTEAVSPQISQAGEDSRRKTFAQCVKRIIYQKKREPQRAHALNQLWNDKRGCLRLALSAIQTRCNITVFNAPKTIGVTLSDLDRMNQFYFTQFCSAFNVQSCGFFVQCFFGYFLCTHG